ncbi:MAG: class I SAM-dependent methyltransferase, partial [Ignavibacteria bacterium]|nr:class I SAM-dependent methyltransferase [Ignavibacteria bacterium]
MKDNTGTSQEVLEYYKRNWKEIVSCYDIGEDGLPRDPAFYRRRVYLNILQESKADNILDVGCGGGRTVLDALQMGRQAQGIEPIEPLAKEAKTLLAEFGQDPDLIKKADMAELQYWNRRTFGTVAVLSVLPHVNVQQ